MRDLPEGKRYVVAIGTSPSSKTAWSFRLPPRASMYLSRARVKTDVASIFTKLDVWDRAQAVVLGYENGRVRANVTAQTRSDPR